MNNFFANISDFVAGRIHLLIYLPAVLFLLFISALMLLMLLEGNQTQLLQKAALLVFDDESPSQKTEAEQTVEATEEHRFLVVCHVFYCYQNRARF